MIEPTTVQRLQTYLQDKCSTGISRTTRPAPFQGHNRQILGPSARPATAMPLPAPPRPTCKTSHYVALAEPPLSPSSSRLSPPAKKFKAAPVSRALVYLSASMCMVSVYGWGKHSLVDDGHPRQLLEAGYAGNGSHAHHNHPVLFGTCIVCSMLSNLSSALIYNNAQHPRVFAGGLLDQQLNVGHPDALPVFLLMQIFFVLSFVVQYHALVHYNRGHLKFFSPWRRNRGYPTVFYPTQLDTQPGKLLGNELRRTDKSHRRDLPSIFSSTMADGVLFSPFPAKQRSPCHSLTA